jgi:hypothetical protein
LLRRFRGFLLKVDEAKRLIEEVKGAFGLRRATILNKMLKRSFIEKEIKSID